MKSLFFRLLTIALGVVIVLLAWQGNIGKGLACIVSPASLEIDLSGNQDQTGVS